MLIAPSILSADFGHLLNEIELVEKAGADWIHLDVMDGHFVPNFTFGPVLIDSIRPQTSMFFDAHLMMSNPVEYIPNFLKAGVNSISFHIETLDKTKIPELIKHLHENKVKFGLVLNPETPLETISEFLQSIDLVLIMSVRPGFGGQSFMPECIPKIEKLNEIRNKNPESYKYLIQVDGGINDKTIKLVKDAGTDVVVAGSYIFKNSSYQQAIVSLR